MKEVSFQDYLISNKVESKGKGLKESSEYCALERFEGLKGEQSKEILVIYRGDVEGMPSEEISPLVGTKDFSKLREGEVFRLLVGEVKISFNFALILLEEFVSFFRKEEDLIFRLRLFLQFKLLKRLKYNDKVRLFSIITMKWLFIASATS